MSLLAFHTHFYNSARKEVQFYKFFLKTEQNCTRADSVELKLVGVSPFESFCTTWLEFSLYAFTIRLCRPRFKCNSSNLSCAFLCWESNIRSLALSLLVCLDFLFITLIFFCSFCRSFEWSRSCFCNSLVRLSSCFFSDELLRLLAELLRLRIFDERLWLKRDTKRNRIFELCEWIELNAIEM